MQAPAEARPAAEDLVIPDRRLLQPLPGKARRARVASHMADAGVQLRPIGQGTTDGHDAAKETKCSPQPRSAATLPVGGHANSSTDGACGDPAQPASMRVPGVAAGGQPDSPRRQGEAPSRRARVRWTEEQAQLQPAEDDEKEGGRRRADRCDLLLVITVATAIIVLVLEVMRKMSKVRDPLAQGWLRLKDSYRPTAEETPLTDLTSLVAPRGEAEAGQTPAPLVDLSTRQGPGEPPALPPPHPPSTPPLPRPGTAPPPPAAAFPRVVFDDETGEEAMRRSGFWIDGVSELNYDSGATDGGR